MRADTRQALIAGVVTLLMSACATPTPPGATAPRQHPIFGIWTFEVPDTDCTETYTFRSDGTSSYSSAGEVGESRFEISEQPSAAGYYTLVDTVTRNNGKPDCMGETLPIGDKVTLYVRFHPEHATEFIMCLEESDEECFGPFTKLDETAS